MTPRLTVALGAGAGLLALAASILALTARGRQATPAPPGPSSGPATTLAIEAFRVLDRAPRSWTAAAFAESLASRLARMPGLTVRVGDGSFGSASEFTVRGDVATREGRLVIAARLLRGGDHDPVWTATFWRGDSLTTDLVSDLAGGIAEAVYGQLARDPSTPRNGP